MSEESTTPDLVELVRRSVEAAGKRDLDAHMAFYAPDAVWDASPMGIGTFEGQAAMRGFWETGSRPTRVGNFRRWRSRTSATESPLLCSIRGAARRQQR